MTNILVNFEKIIPSGVILLNQYSIISKTSQININKFFRKDKKYFLVTFRKGDYDIMDVTNFNKNDSFNFDFLRIEKKHYLFNTHFGLYDITNFSKEKIIDAMNYCEKSPQNIEDLFI
jgi:hypothetical protein